MGPALLPTPLSPMRGLVFRRTFRRALGTRRFPALPASWPPGSVTGARTGIRSCPAPVQVLGPSPSTPGQTEADHPLPSISSGSASAEAFAFPSMAGRCARPVADCFASFSNGPLASDRSLLHVVLEDRADSFRYIEPDRKTLHYQVVRPSTEVFFSPVRQVEIASGERVDQGWQPRLIHFSPNSLWTRVDNSTAHLKLNDRAWPAAANAAH